MEFANEPTVERGSATHSHGETQLFTPARYPVGGGGELASRTLYNGRPAGGGRDGVGSRRLAKRCESRETVRPVHAEGGFYIAVTLWARAAEVAENPGSALSRGWRSWVTS